MRVIRAVRGEFMPNDSFEFSTNGRLYLDAPDDWSDYEEGTFALSESTLNLPSDLSLELDNIKKSLSRSNTRRQTYDHHHDEIG